MEQDLSLIVINKTTGLLETNIAELEALVETKLQEYNPDSYFGDADSAKKDRAVLNNSKKALTQERIRIVKELMKPYEDFESRCKALEKKIDCASGKLDEIVKAKEAEEKDAKKMMCLLVWKEKNFDLFPMDKVFNPKWLNKTMKKSEISKEMDEIIAKTYNDLKLIERFGEDTETLKALYLEDLDITEVFSRGEELQKNREKIAKEKAERQEREKEEQLEKQDAELERDVEKVFQREKIDDISIDALSDEFEDLTPKEENWVLSFTATEEQVRALKTWLTSNRIVYDNCEKLEF